MKPEIYVVCLSGTNPTWVVRKIASIDPSSKIKQYDTYWYAFIDATKLNQGLLQSDWYYYRGRKN